MTPLIVENDIKDISVGEIDHFQEAVKLAREIESKSHSIKSVVTTKNWFEKMAERAEIGLDDDISDLKKTLPTKQVTLEQKKKTELLKRLLANLDRDKSDFVLVPYWNCFPYVSWFFV